MTLQEMQQRRAQLAAEMRSLHESVGDGDMSGEQRGKWEAMRAEYNKLGEKVKREEELREADQDEIEQRDRRTPARDALEPEEERRAQAQSEWLRRGAADMSPELRAVMAEMRAQAAGTPAAGGFTIARSFERQVVESMNDFGGIATVCQLLETDNGAPIDWSVAQGESEEGELLGENATATEGDVAFGSGTLGAHLLSSKVIRVSETLLADTGVDLEGFLARRMASRLARIRARLIVQGTGAGNPAQPSGLATAAAVGKQVATAATLSWKDINALIHSIDPAYRMAPGFRLAFNDVTLQLIEEMVDGQNRPLWLPGIDASRPGTILGKQYVVDKACADMAAGVKFMYAGDFQQCILRRVRGMALKRLVERYAEFGQVGFLGFDRFGFILQDTAAVKAMTGK